MTMKYSSLHLNGALNRPELQWSKTLDAVYMHALKSKYMKAIKDCKKQQLLATKPDHTLIASI